MPGASERRVMRQAIIDGPGKDFVIREVPVPQPGPVETLLRITVSTVCSRTDLGTIDGYHPPHGSAVMGMLPHDLRIQLGRSELDVSRPYYPSSAFPGTAFPAVMGHEAAGTVVALGAEANSPGHLVVSGQPIRVGDRVGTYRVHGGYSDYSALDTANVFRTPDFMTDEEASLMEPLIANYNCLHRCWSIAVPKTVVIIGQGCQGLFSTQVARALGTELIIVSELSGHKRRLAVELGADVAIDPAGSNVVHEVEKLTGSAGADLVVECVGREETIRAVPFLVRRGGMIAQIGALTQPVTFDYGYVHFKHFIVVPVAYIRTLREVADQVVEVLELIKAGLIRPDRLLTHRFELSDIQAAFELIRRNPGEVVKVAIQMTGTGDLQGTTVWSTAHARAGPAESGRCRWPPAR